MSGSKPERSESAQSLAAIEINGLRHAFGPLEVIGGLDLRIAHGEVVGFVGPSGCGKSTLLELVAGLEQPIAGSIVIDERGRPERDSLAPAERAQIDPGTGATAGDPRRRLAQCAFMPQRDLLLPWLAAIDNAALAPRNRGASAARARAEAQPLFDHFGLGGFERARPAELSGGMRQRVAFLRTLLAGKPVMLLDEPFASLDAITRAEMQEWLADALAEQDRTTLLVSHDVEEALFLCDRVLVLSARPAIAIAELSSAQPRRLPRSETVAEPGFVAVRERALEALRSAIR